MKDNGTKVFSNLLWRFMERLGAQGVSFIVSIVLARLLVPEAYGTVALITVFTTILYVFVDSGLGTALVQKKNADDLDFSSVFFFNVLVCVVLYLGLYLAAPWIAVFFNNDALTPMVRVAGLTLIISGVKNIQQAYVSRNLLFKRFFYATLGGTIFSAFFGVFLAYRGFGAWALIGQQLSNAFIDTLILWLTVKWRPKWMFSPARLKGLLSFGWKLLVSDLIATAYNNLRSLIIGKMYTALDLSFYNKGSNFPMIIVANINASIDSVLMPVLSKQQDDTDAVKDMTRRAMKISTYVMAPMMIGLAVCGKPLIELLLTEKWLPCVPYMRVFCIIYMFYPVHTANLNAIKALGRSDLFLKLEIAKKVMGLTILLSTMWFGPMVMAYSMLVSTALSMVINSWPNKKLLNYGYLEQLKDILPGIMMAVFMGICIYPIQWIGLPDILTLLIQVPLGAVIFIAGSIVFKMESFQYMWGMVRPVVYRVLKKKA